MPLRAFLTNKDAWALTGLVLLTILLPVSFGKSEAAFVAGTSNPGSLFSSASSFNTVDVTLTDPGSPLRSTVMLNAVATSDRGVSSVVFETSPAGAGTWTTACTDNVSPYSCSWDTTGTADGLRDVRAVVTDTAGYSRTDTRANRRVDNTGATATTTDPGSPLTGTASVTGIGSDSGTGVARATVQYRPSGGGSWTDICTQTGATATCAWNTAALADGLYDLRTVAADVAGNPGTPSAVVANRRLDNIAPTATMTAPAANLSGSVTLQSTSADAANGSGVASVRYEYKPSSGSTWTTACTSATTPFSCSFDTTAAGDGLYDFRVVATDGVGKTGTSAAVTSRRIDNTAPTATMGALAASLTGTVSLTSTPADSGSGVASVQYQYKPNSGSTWTDTCSSSTSPHSCSFDTASVTDGLYDFRVVATDNAGNVGTSTAVSSRRIDNTDPTVTMGSLAANLTGTVTLTSTPSDGGGIASVQYQYRLGAGAWTNACSSATSPYSCSFNTASVTDGVYDFRAVATDNAGRTGNSAAVTSRRIDNTDPTVTMTAPAANLGGSVTLASSPADAGSGVASVQYQYKPNSGSTWTNACSSSSSPFSCSFNTTTLTDGLYDFRAIATDNVGRTGTSAGVTARRVDNTAPSSVVLAALPSPLQNAVPMTATAADAGSGIAGVTFQYAPTGTTTWTDACTDASSPYTCSLASAGLADGVYDLRALATDNAGNTRASAIQTRTVDNNGPTVTLISPAAGASVQGTINVDATATDISGVTSVAVQYRLAGAPTWTTLCTDVSSPYSCPLNTSTLASGSYEIRLIGTDTLLKTTTTTPITVTVDNSAPTAVDVQAVNGGTAREIDDGDVITFTWSEPMAPASILAGWGGGAQAIRVKVSDNGGDSLLELYDQTGTTRLNVTSAAGLLLDGDYVGTTTLWLNGSMNMSGNDVTVTIGSLISGTTATVNPNVDMVWASATGATDLAGNSATGNTVTESGKDRDF